MRRPIQPLVALFLLAGFAPAAAQDGARVDPQTAWRRAATNLNALTVAMIDYARDHGDSPEQAGRHVGELLGDAWVVPADAEPAAFFAGGMAANFESWPGMSPVVGEEAGGMVVRYHRVYRNWFGDDDEAFGVTVAEYEAYIGGLVAAIADRLGLEVRIATDADLAVLHVATRDGS